MKTTADPQYRIALFPGSVKEMRLCQGQIYGGAKAPSLQYSNIIIAADNPIK
jgi:hypothetical protein